MAKVAAKSSKEPKKTTTKTASAKAKSSNEIKIDKVCQDALEKLKSMDLDAQLQRDLEWCLGSFKSDNNPVGLYDMARRALDVFKQEKEKKTKGVTAKTITDIEKVLEGQQA